MVDTLGLLLAVVVHAADVQDRDGAKIVLKEVLKKFTGITTIWADGGYAGKLIDWARDFGGWALTIVKRRPVPRFEVLPKRWIVERTFGWLNRSRRLSKDYEEHTANSETVVMIAMINLMSRRLARK